MYNVVLGNFTCENNRVDKTDYITYSEEVLEVEVLENGTEEDSYIFVLDKPMNELNNYNYCSINGREYFLQPTKAIDGGMCEVYAKEDILMQAREYIYNSTQLVERNAKFVNAYLTDNMIPTASYDTINCIEFPNAINDDSIVLVTVG